MSRAVAIVVCLAALGGCARRIPPSATVGDAQRANIELTDLEHGRALLIRKCGGCHRPPMPAEHTAAAWPSKLDEMSVRANLDGEQRRVIQQYLVTMADAGR